MPKTLFTAEDRLAVHDLLGRYVWAIDTGDIDAVVNLFAKDAVIRYGEGDRYEGTDGVRTFAQGVIARLKRLGRMHLNHPLYLVETENAVVLRSYLCVVQWLMEPDSKALRTLNYTDDTCVKTPIGWRIAERVIWRWNDMSQPWHGPALHSHAALSPAH